jgi:HSP20 family molecular chaperone IbpA
VNTSDEKVSATYENGILKIKIEKDLKAISAKKEIPVQ